MRKNRLSWYQQQRLTERFVAGATARTAACWVGVNTKRYCLVSPACAAGRQVEPDQATDAEI